MMYFDINEIKDEAHSMARQIIKNAIRAAGERISAHKPADISKQALQLLKTDPSIMDDAEIICLVRNKYLQRRRQT